MVDDAYMFVCKESTSPMSHIAFVSFCFITHRAVST